MKNLLAVLVLALVLAWAGQVWGQDEGGGGDAAPAAGEGEMAPAEGEAGEGGEGEVGDGQQDGKGKGGPLGGMMVPLLLMFVVLYFFMFRGPKKKQQQHQQMLSGLQKNDRVRTIGGIIGAVVDIRDDEVVIKIDEATNAKMRIARNAISKVIRDDEEQK